MTINNILLKMAFGGHLGLGYLRLHSKWSPHTRKRFKRHNLSFSMAYSELKCFKDGVWRPSWIWLLEVLAMQKCMQNWIPHTRKPLKLEDMTVLKRSPDLLNNVKIGQDQLQLIMKHISFYRGCCHFGQVT